jgi:alkylation response protein AidB-like acyl-CoA dehydrogenase
VPTLPDVTVSVSDRPTPVRLSEAGLSADAFARAVSRARIRHAAYLIGLTRRAIDAAAAHVREREQFGRRLVDFQAVSFPLAALFVELEAGRLVTHRAAWLTDQGRPAELAALEALAGAADLLTDGARTAVHLHGTRGLLRANPVARIYLCGREEILRFGTAPELWRQAGRLRLSARLDPDDRDAVC